MQYKDYTDPITGEKWVNGVYMGVRMGSALQDAANPTVYDSHAEATRSTNHIGTTTQDAAAEINFEEK